MAGAKQALKRFSLVLIKPSHYDDDGYLIQWFRSAIPSNTLAVMNGLALHGGVIPYGGTFLVFSDYARNALRLAALMGVRTIYVFSLGDEVMNRCGRCLQNIHRCQFDSQLL